MATAPKTNVVVFPFDAFGSSGSAQGAELLGDAIREILEDNEQEPRSIRADVYRNQIKLQEISFATTKALAGWKSVGRQLLRQAIKNRERTIWLGGNHLSVLPVYEELGGDAQAKQTLVIQFDAHLDVYQLHDVNPNPAPGNFLLHSEESLPGIVALGHRDLFLPHAEIDRYFARTYSVLDISRNLQKIQADLASRIQKAKRIWIDIDVDVVDPTHLPAVETPLPFGLPPLVLLELLDTCWSDKLVGVSLSEFVPARDQQDQSLNLLGWLIEWIMLRWYEPASEMD